MTSAKKCGCGKDDANKPKDIKTDTMVKPDDFGKMKPKKEGVSDEEVEESVVLINPDVESMESRG